MTNGTLRCLSIANRSHSLFRFYPFLQTAERAHTHTYIYAHARRKRERKEKKLPDKHHFLIFIRIPPNRPILRASFHPRTFPYIPFLLYLRTRISLPFYNVSKKISVRFLIKLESKSNAGVNRQNSRSRDYHKRKLYGEKHRKWQLTRVNGIVDAF